MAEYQCQINTTLPMFMCNKSIFLAKFHALQYSPFKAEFGLEYLYSFFLIIVAHLLNPRTANVHPAEVPPQQ